METWNFSSFLEYSTVAENEKAIPVLVVGDKTSYYKLIPRILWHCLIETNSSKIKILKYIIEKNRIGQPKEDLRPFNLNL
jgi:hypothetical protein